MKSTLLLSALLSCFVIQSNAQDSVPTTAPVSSYATQGNVAQNRSVYDRELQRAAVEARRMKELKAAIASQSFGPPPATITTASQFLAANRPPMPAPSEAPEAERPAAYVPEFDTGEPSPPSEGSSPDLSSGDTPNFALPQKQERNFFKWLKTKKEEPEFEPLPPAGASGYQENPYQSPPTTSSPPAPSTQRGIPDVPAVNERAPVPPPAAPPAVQENSGPAPIFVRRETEGFQSSGTAVIGKDSEAFVNGVLVKLFAGTQVTVLSSAGSDATVRLPDGRVGTVKRRSLSR